MKFKVEEDLPAELLDDLSVAGRSFGQFVLLLLWKLHHFRNNLFH